MFLRNLKSNLSVYMNDNQVIDIGSSEQLVVDLCCLIFSFVCSVVSVIVCLFVLLVIGLSFFVIWLQIIPLTSIFEPFLLNAYCENTLLFMEIVIDVTEQKKIFLLRNQSLTTAENKSQYSLTITIIWNVTQSITKDCKKDYGYWCS